MRMSYQSKVNSDREFNEEQWVVSFINTNTGMLGQFAGHAAIVVEGLLPAQDSGALFSSLFVGHYDIRAMAGETACSVLGPKVRQTLTNVQGYVSQVQCLERNKYLKNEKIDIEEFYGKCKGRSGDAPRKLVLEMIAEIKKDRDRTEFGLHGCCIHFHYSDVVLAAPEVINEKNTYVITLQEDKTWEIKFYPTPDTAPQIININGIPNLKRHLQLGEMPEVYEAIRALHKGPINPDYLIPFQSAGWQRWNAPEQGDNCATWANKKLEIAGLEIQGSILDYLKTSPGVHASEGFLDFCFNK